MESEFRTLTPVGFDRFLGLEFTHVSDELMCGTLEVREELLQPSGLVHGGVYASIAESLASLGTWIGVVEEDKVVVGLSNQTSFLRPMLGGVINARALRRHRGRTTWVWEVEFVDDQERLCVLTRMTIAVRDGSPPAAGRRGIAAEGQENDAVGGEPDAAGPGALTDRARPGPASTE